MGRFVWKIDGDIHLAVALENMVVKLSTMGSAFFRAAEHSELRIFMIGTLNSAKSYIFLSSLDFVIAPEIDGYRSIDCDFES